MPSIPAPPEMFADALPGFELDDPSASRCWRLTRDRASVSRASRPDRFDRSCDLIGTRGDSLHEVLILCTSDDTDETQQIESPILYRYFSSNFNVLSAGLCGRWIGEMNQRGINR